MPPAASTVGPTRRALLGAALLVPLAGCGIRWDDVRLDDVATPAPPTLGEDDLARFEAVALVTALREAAGALDVPAAVAAVAAHERHLEALGPLPGPVPTPSSTPSGWPTTSAAASPPADAAALAVLEQDAAARLLDLACGEASTVGGPLARLLAGVSAGCRTTAAALGASTPAAALPDQVDPSGADAATDGLLALVTAHRAAAYGYGVLGAALDDAGRDAARTSLASHRSVADALAELAGAAGVEVPPGAPAWSVPPVADAPAARTLAHGLETDVAVAAADLVAASTGGWRTLAGQQLAAAATDLAAWGPVPAFPGLPELA